MKFTITEVRLRRSLGIGEVSPRLVEFHVSFCVPHHEFLEAGIDPDIREIAPRLMASLDALAGVQLKMIESGAVADILKSEGFSE